MLKKFSDYIRSIKYAKLILVLFSFLILIGIVFGSLYLLTPNNFASPKSDHYHLRLQYVFKGQVEDFGSPRYQTDYIKDVCEGKLTESPMHFHDAKTQIVHLHWQRMTGGQFLKFYGLNKIGGIDNIMGWKIDDLLKFPPKLIQIPIHSYSLPRPTSSDNFFVYLGDKDKYVEKNFQDFINQDFETFTGVNSKERLDQEKAKEFEQKMKTGSNAIKVEAHQGHNHSNDSEANTDPNSSNNLTATTKTEEELKQINNLIGNIVIFVQPEKPTDEQIKSRFNDLTPLGLSKCGG